MRKRKRKRARERARCRQFCDRLSSLFTIRNKHQAFTIEALDVYNFVSVFVPARLLSKESKFFQDDSRPNEERIKEYISFAITYSKSSLFSVHFLVSCYATL